MKLLIDIGHIPHINLFKNAVVILKEQGIDIKVICLDRGRNVLIAKEEFKGAEVIPLGKHRGYFFSIIFEANILRFLLLFKYLLINRFDVGLSAGSFLLGFGLKILQKPNLQYYDDPENKKNLFFQKLTATKLFYPMFFKSDGIINFNALKEWAYLSPKYFNPDKECLKEYNLKEKEYIFVREVNSNTTNYVGQTSEMISTIADKFPSDINVILSLENKEKMNYYPESWIVLNEPVNDIHSLMYYSKVLLSSGDSMAREGAMLGVPSIYCGIREMAANEIMKEKNLLFQINISEVPNLIQNFLNNEVSALEQNKFRKELDLEWDDVTELIVSSVLDIKI